MMKLKRNLVISAVGDESLHRHWMPCDGYDIFLIYYGDNEGFPGESEFYKRRKGTKFRLIHEMVEDIKKYDYIWMPDDDICLKPKYIRRMFHIAGKYNLEICQPSIIGWYGLKVTLCHHDSFLRYTNYVEIMCPCFSQRALRICKNTFLENKSGWGIDAVWHLLLGQPTDKLAIIDEVVAVHTRAMGSGDMYKDQLMGQMDAASEEAAEVYEKYNIKDANYEDLKHGKSVSQELFQTLYYNTVEFGRIHRSMEAGLDVSERIWPRGDMIRGLCDEIRAGERDDV